MLVDNLIASKQLEESLKDKVLDTLYLRHHHLYQRKHHEDSGGSRFHLPIIRSLADIGKKFSAPGNLHNNGNFLIVLFKIWFSRLLGHHFVKKLENVI